MIQPDWAGETAFIIAGGPSVKDQNIELLRGRRVVVINSSIEVAPWADVLFFGDSRWGRLHRAKFADFKGRVITCSHVSKFTEKVEVLHKASPGGGLSRERHSLMMRRTSLSGAINLAVHLGVSGIVLLGADGKYGPNGERHHHADHPWPHRDGCWNLQRQELEKIVPGLGELGVRVINASPGSAWPMWPVMSLSEAMAEMECDGLSGHAVRSNLCDVGSVSVIGAG